MQNLDIFTRQYLVTALWSSMDNMDEETGGEPLDKNYTIDDIASETLEEVIEECRLFQQENYQDIGSNLSLAGHDFWLTRNQHGSGFSDGDWPEEVGKRLTTSAHSYGEYTLWLGDDDLIHGT